VGFAQGHEGQLLQIWETSLNLLTLSALSFFGSNVTHLFGLRDLGRPVSRAEDSQADAEGSFGGCLLEELIRLLRYEFMQLAAARKLQRL